jgi:phosphoserine phosphatase
VRDPKQSTRPLYRDIQATGDVVLGIEDEEHKARVALDLALELGIPPQEVAHMGDTMGDSGGILGVARAGGLGVAFNYNRALEAFLWENGHDLLASGRVALVDPKGPGADLRHVIPLLDGAMR